MSVYVCYRCRRVCVCPYSRVCVHVYPYSHLCVCVCVCVCVRARAQQAEKGGGGCAHSSGVVETFLPGSSSGTGASDSTLRPLAGPVWTLSLGPPHGPSRQNSHLPPFPDGLHPEDEHLARSLHVCGGPWAGALKGVRGGPQADPPAWAVGGVPGPCWAGGG